MSLLPRLVGNAAWGGKTTADMHKGSLDCLHDLMLAQARYLDTIPYPRPLSPPLSPALPLNLTKAQRCLDQNAAACHLVVTRLGYLLITRQVTCVSPPQAQRCFYEKAVRDSMSPKLLAKVAKGA